MERTPVGVVIVGVLLCAKSLLWSLVLLLAAIGAALLGPVMLTIPFLLLLLLFHAAGILVGLGLMGCQAWAWRVAVVYLMVTTGLELLTGIWPSCISLVLLGYLLYVGEHFR